MFVARFAERSELEGKEGLRPDLEGFINAALVTRDELVSAMDERDARIALGLMEGKTNAAIAEEEQVSTSAISQRALGAGIYAVLRADRLLRSAFEGSPA